MSIYFEEARKLGQLLLTSELAIQLADANAVLETDMAAQARMHTYSGFQDEVRQGMKDGALSQADVQAATQKLSDMAEELKRDPVIGAVIFAEKEFNLFVNQVLNVLKLTVTGGAQDDGEGCEGCSGGACGSGPCPTC